MKRKKSNHLSSRRIHPGSSGGSTRQLYGVGERVFVNSYMLLYFKALGLSSERILLYLSIPMFMRFIMLLPAARYTGCIGAARTRGIWVSLFEPYDARLTLCGIMVLVLIVTPGMIPAVVKRGYCCNE